MAKHLASLSPSYLIRLHAFKRVLCDVHVFDPEIHQPVDKVGGGTFQRAYNAYCRRAQESREIILLRLRSGEQGILLPSPLERIGPPLSDEERRAKRRHEERHARGRSDAEVEAWHRRHLNDYDKRRLEMTEGWSLEDLERALKKPNQ